MKDRYEFASIWSNFLWDLHRQWGFERAFPVILQAHLKPLPQADPASHPVRRYLQALRTQAISSRASASHGAVPTLAKSLTSAAVIQSTCDRHLAAFFQQVA